MKIKWMAALCVMGLPAWAQQVVPGVSYELATQRLATLSNVQYTLDFNIPAQKRDSIRASETIAFVLKKNESPLCIDFKQSADHVQRIKVNAQAIPVNLQAEHLLIDQKYLHPGKNTVDIDFIAGDASLNRNDEYLYALFVPDRARTVFPCFDQPSIKARFALTLHIPSQWKALANGKLLDTLRGETQTTYHFAVSDPLPTYLFSFTAGKYNRVVQPVASRSAEFLYRETDSVKINRSVDSIFKIHDDAVKFLQAWTGIDFPFKKIGFVAIPDFQFGGMEHPGEVQYKASSLFLDDGATKDQLLARGNLISHETAHMWFGDLVTMQWFNDVWMKEVFANFMADKVAEKVMGTDVFQQKFLLDHFPAAYGVDRTPGANPIRQQLSNLQDAGSMYGNIIYHKAPIMMRQLEMVMGKDAFQKGMQAYLKKYSYACATWPDLIGILQQHTTQDLGKWNEVWVNQTGRPVFDYQLQQAGAFVNSITVNQQAETGAPRVWPQAFDITFVYPDHEKVLKMWSAGGQTKLKLPEKTARPTYILFNTDGAGYGLFPVDSALQHKIFSLPNAVQRASVYVNDYENMLAGRYYKPAALLQLFMQGLQTEQNEMNLRLLSGYITNIYWEFIAANDRAAITATLEDALWSAMRSQSAPNNQKILFKAFQDVYGSAEAQQNMYKIWEDKKAPLKVKLSEDDYTSLALTIALKSDTAISVLPRQMERIADPDRRQRLQFMQPALSPDSSVRDAFFASLLQVQNRRKEAWVTAALYYLHHPLRQHTSGKYLAQSLSLLEEIQRTGDIFFPQSWLAATFGMYRDAQAWQVVQDFLQAHPDYNPKLKNQIMQTTDNLRRVQQIR